MNASGLQKPNKAVVFSVHILAWGLLAFTFLLYQPLSWGVTLPAVFWIKQSIHLLLLVTLYYLNSLYFVPQLLLKNKPGIYALIILAAILVAYAINSGLDNWLHVWERMKETIPGLPPRPKPKGIDGFFVMSILLILGISTSVALVQQWQQEKTLRTTSEQQRVNAELSFLKAQINPHFFFNTLNNIYALSFTDGNQSREALLKLSRMMRYLLYETQSDKTLLSKELSFVKDYIELMRMRTHEKTTIIFQEPVLTRDIDMAPMLLLPFVENAFKYGVSTLQQTEIIIKTTLDNGVLTLVVENHVFADNHKESNLESGGIGLTNTARRLDLLYPNRHELLVSNNPEQKRYRVELKIQL